MDPQKRIQFFEQDVVLLQVEMRNFTRISPESSTTSTAICKTRAGSGVARAFPGGRAAHPEDQNEEENEEKLRKNEKSYRKMRKD